MVNRFFICLLTIDFFHFNYTTYRIIILQFVSLINVSILKYHFLVSHIDSFYYSLPVKFNVCFI